MTGLYDGSCPVCGGHIYGEIGEDGKRTPWECRQCGATQETPVFNENREIEWGVLCHLQEECKHYRTVRCINCELCCEVNLPCSVIADEKPVNILNEIIYGITYKQLAERYGAVTVTYMSYTAETRILFDGEKWEVSYNYD